MEATLEGERERKVTKKLKNKRRKNAPIHYTKCYRIFDDFHAILYCCLGEFCFFLFVLGQHVFIHEWGEKYMSGSMEEMKTEKIRNKSATVHIPMTISACYSQHLTRIRVLFVRSAVKQCEYIYSIHLCLNILRLVGSFFFLLLFVYILTL